MRGGENKFGSIAAEATARNTVGNNYRRMVEQRAGHHIHFSGQFDLKLDIFECLVSHVAFKYVLMSAFWLINPLQACDRRPSESQEV